MDGGGGGGGGGSCGGGEGGRWGRGWVLDIGARRRAEATSEVPWPRPRRPETARGEGQIRLQMLQVAGVAGLRYRGEPGEWARDRAETEAGGIASPRPLECVRASVGG